MFANKFVSLHSELIQLHAIDEHGAVIMRKRLTRGQVLPVLEKIPPCLVGMEACGSAHHWAREIQALGHEVRLMPAQYVEPYVKQKRLIGLRPNNRTVSLLTLCGHFPSHIVEGLLRRLVSDRGMASLPVVEDLNVFEDCGLGFRPCFEALLVDQLLFQ